MALSSYPSPVDPRQLRECIGMAGEDLLGQIVHYEGREFSYETATHTLTTQLIPFRPLIQRLISEVSSLSDDTEDKRTLQIKTSSLNEGMIILSASLQHRLQLAKEGRVDPKEAFPFQIPISVLKVALHISSLLTVRQLGQIVQPPSYRPQPPIRIMQYGQDTYIVKLPLLSTASSGKDEFYIHSLVTGLPHILPLAWACTSRLATLYCPYTLKSYLEKFPDLETAHYKKLLRELLTGLFHLHNKRVVHCDIKPENIFITDKGSLEIGDFGLSSIIGDLYSKKGSTAYFAPEIVARTPPFGPPPRVAPQRDIWALGIVVWTICTKKPFTYCTEILEYYDFLRSPYLQELVDATIKGETFPPDLADLLKRMLRVNPEERITAEQALTHPYLEAPAVTT